MQEGLSGNLDRIHKSSKVLTEFKHVTAKEAKEMIQFEHVEEGTRAAVPAEMDEHLAMPEAASKKQAAQRETVIAEDMSEDSATVAREYRPESRDG